MLVYGVCSMSTRVIARQEYPYLADDLVVGVHLPSEAYIPLSDDSLGLEEQRTVSLGIPNLNLKEALRDAIHFLNLYQHQCRVPL